MSIAPFRLARAADARAVLGARDPFVSVLSPFDRALRLASATPVDEAAYLAFTAQQGLDWTPAEEERIRRTVLRVDAGRKVRGLALASFAPPEVLIVKTTGKEEFALPYSRGAAIALPAKSLTDASDDALVEILSHEFFHVLSHHSATLRERAYRLIGFERRGDLMIPPEIEPIRITNPDGYRNDFALTLPRGNDTLQVVPFLVANKPFDLKVGNFVLDYADFVLLVVTSSNGAMQVARRKDGKPEVLDPRESEYIHCVGRNAVIGGVIHPDEVMADNFVRVLARGEPSHPREPTPELVDAFEALLRTGNANAAPRRCAY